MIIEGDKVDSISLSPHTVDQQIYNYTFMGVAIYNKQSILNAFNGIDFSGMTEKHIENSLNNSVNVYAVEYSKKWWHIETTDDYIKEKDKYFWEVVF